VVQVGFDECRQQPNQLSLQKRQHYLHCIRTHSERGPHVCRYRHVAKYQLEVHSGLLAGLLLHHLESADFGPERFQQTCSILVQLLAELNVLHDPLHSQQWHIDLHHTQSRDWRFRFTRVSYPINRLNPLQHSVECNRVHAHRDLAPIWGGFVQ